MKKLVILLISVFFFCQSQAQKMDFWLDAGAKVQYGGSLLFNGALGDDPNWDYTFTTVTKFGGKLGINWNYTGISLDVMVGKTRGIFQNTDAAMTPDREVSLSTTDIYLLFRDARNKGYIEIGPKMSLVGDVKNFDKGGSEGADVNTEYYNSMPLGAVLGFGTYVLGNDGRFSGIIGLRFEYGFNDIVTAEGGASSLAENRQPVNYIGDMSSTNPIFAGIVFELNWGIGGVGQARCGERSKFIFF